MPRAKREITSDAVVMRVDISKDGAIPKWLIGGRHASLIAVEDRRRREAGLPRLDDHEKDALVRDINMSGQTEISLDGSLLTALWLLAPSVPQEARDGPIKRDAVDMVHEAAFEVAWQGELENTSFSRAVQGRIVQTISELAGADRREFEDTLAGFRAGDWKFFGFRAYRERLAAHESCAFRREVNKGQDARATSTLSGTRRL